MLPPNIILCSSKAEREIFQGRIQVSRFCACMLFYILIFLGESSQGIKWTASSFTGAKSLYFSSRGPSLGMHCLELDSSGAVCLAFYSCTLSGSSLELVPQDLSFMDTTSTLPPVPLNACQTASSCFKNLMFLGADKTRHLQWHLIDVPIFPGVRVTACNNVANNVACKDEPVSCFSKSVMHK